MVAGGDPCGVATMGHTAVRALGRAASALFVACQWPGEIVVALEQSAACKPVQSVIWGVAVGAAEIAAEFVTSVPTVALHCTPDLRASDREAAEPCGICVVVDCEHPCHESAAPRARRPSVAELR